MIVIVDYEVGNIAAIKNMLKKCGFDAILSHDHEVIGRASKIILPGIGAFDSCVQNLDKYELRGVLDECVLEKKIPILGICVGMQLLAKGSEEGVLSGLGWIDGFVKKFILEGTNFKVPHMGWNTLVPQFNNPLFKDLEDSARFYFAHSFHFTCKNPENEGAITNYGYRFASSVKKDNIFGTQFHPEKSHKYGMKILANFANLDSDKKN
jgi:imidazole glycerol-phosphate synthase subunit HisH